MKAKILNYIAKDAVIINAFENKNCSICVSKYENMYIVSRKFSTLTEPTHDIYDSIEKATDRFLHITGIINNPKQ